MENYPITKLEVSINNDELVKCQDVNALRTYLYDVVSPVICNAIITVPKGGELSGEVRCSTDRGCEVRIGGTIRF